jgi:hypothetical protein
MGSDESPTTDVQSPQTITDCLSNLERGDIVYVNDRKMAYEVVDTDTYSVIVTDEHGNQVSFSQNLQSGGWVVSEDIWRVDVPSE